MKNITDVERSIIQANSLRPKNMLEFLDNIKDAEERRRTMIKLLKVRGRGR